MKSILKIVVAIVLVQLLASCEDDPKQVTAKPTKKLVVLAYDISMSNDDYAILKENHLKELFSKVAFNGGGKFYSILIKTKSKEQEIFEYTIPAYDTLDLIGNPYQVKKRMKRNAEILAPFHNKQADFIQKTKSAVIKPKTEHFTDLKNAMQLAEGTLNQILYSNRDKYLIIIRDGINDLPQRNGEDKIKTTHLEDVKVILVRPTRTKYVTGSSLITTNSIQDALYNL